MPHTILRWPSPVVRLQFTEAARQAIVQAVVNLARDLNMTTTAEGIETEKQMRTVRDLGCREMQGYFFSRPQPAADVARMLAPRAVRVARAA